MAFPHGAGFGLGREAGAPPPPPPPLARLLQLQQQLQQQQQQQQQQSAQQHAPSQQLLELQQLHQLQLQAMQLQQWLPNPMLLQALGQQGAGQYRITLRPESALGEGGVSDSGLSAGSSALLALQPHANAHANAHAPSMFGSGQLGSGQLGSGQLGSGQLGGASSSSQLASQQLMMQLMVQNQQQMLLARSAMLQQQHAFFMGGGSAPARPDLGMLSVDVVNNDALGGPVTMYQAGSLRTPQKGLPEAAAAAAGTQQKVRKKRFKRDPLAPKPARYAWNFFFKKHYKQFRAKEFGDERFDVQKAFTDIGASLGDHWTKLTTEEREPYFKLAAEDKKRFAREMLVYLKRSTSNSANDEGEGEGEGATEGAGEDATKGAGEGEGETEGAAENEGDESELDDDLVAKRGPKRVKSSGSVNSGEEEGEPQPPAKASAAMAAAAAAVAAPVDLELTADVLVTDDDDAFIFMIQKTLCKIASENGVKLNVDVASSGADALRKVLDEKKNYAVVTMDKDMGDDIDGIETVKRLREAGYAGFVVGVSGNDWSTDFARVGADASMVKCPSLFKQVYRMIIEKKESRKGFGAQA